MNEFSEVAEELSGVGGVKESTPGARPADVTSGDGGDHDASGKSSRTSPPAESSSVRTHTELDVQGIPLDAKVGRIENETIKHTRKGQCPADSPAGTRCKLCGKEHPQRSDRKSVKIHVPDRGLDVKTDFKKKGAK